MAGVCLLAAGCGRDLAVPDAPVEDGSSAQAADDGSESGSDSQAADDVPDAPAEDGSGAQAADDDSESGSDPQAADGKTGSEEKEDAKVDWPEGGWRAEYLSYLEGTESSETTYYSETTYSFIYVDDDEIPELVVDTGIEAGGCALVTYHEGKGTDVFYTGRRHFEYMERENLVNNADGNMGNYWDIIVSIVDGKWEYVAQGTHREKWEDGGVVFDKDGNAEVIYDWNGESVTKEEYEAALASCFDSDRAVEPSRYYVYEEARSLLLTGETSSAGHRYELVRSDATWEEAWQQCAQKGGYLAVITSTEEFLQISRQIREENKTDLCLWIGMENPRDPERRYWGYSWKQPKDGGEEYTEAYPRYFNVYYDFWQAEEPSYTGLTKEGDETRENCVCMVYDGGTDRFYWKDMPDDLLAADPSYAGRMGYICEYDEEDSVRIGDMSISLSESRQDILAKLEEAGFEYGEAQPAPPGKDSYDLYYNAAGCLQIYFLENTCVRLRLQVFDSSAGHLQTARGLRPRDTYAQMTALYGDGYEKHAYSYKGIYTIYRYTIGDVICELGYEGTDSIYNIDIYVPSQIPIYDYGEEMSETT